jgi:hypothetical protein
MQKYLLGRSVSYVPNRLQNINGLWKLAPVSFTSWTPFSVASELFDGNEYENCSASRMKKSTERVWGTVSLMGRTTVGTTRS